MPLISRVEQVAALGQRVAHELRRLLISGQLSAGTRLVEDQLATQFGVSRGPIRDAFRQLTTEGLLESRRPGVFVKGVTERDVDELYSLREALESLALRLAMETATSADWQRLTSAIEAMRDAADRRSAADFAKADLEYHSHFYRLSRHSRLTDVWEHYRPTFAVMLDITTAQDSDLHPSAEAHAELLTVAMQGDPEAAVTNLAEHLLGARNRLRSALQTAQRRHLEGEQA